MLEKIEKLKWSPEMEQYLITESDINDNNELIDYYNLAPIWSKIKKIVWELLYLSHPKSLWEVVWIDLWVPLKETLTIEDEKRLLYLSRLISKFSKKIDNILSSEEYKEFN